jgi:hypothetical protein
MIWLRRLALLGVLFLGVLTTGCGSSGPTVSGHVSYRGVALTNGGVMIHGPDGTSAYGGIGPDGSYTVRNAPRGPVRISVSVPVFTPLPRRLAAGFPAAQLPVQPSTVIAIPAKYARPDSSGLTVLVEAGSQQHDINLP